MIHDTRELLIQTVGKKTHCCVAKMRNFCPYEMCESSSKAVISYFHIFEMNMIRNFLMQRKRIYHILCEHHLENKFILHVSILSLNYICVYVYKRLIRPDIMNFMVVNQRTIISKDEKLSLVYKYNNQQGNENNNNIFKKNRGFNISHYPQSIYAYIY